MRQEENTMFKMDLFTDKNALGIEAESPDALTKAKAGLGVIARP